jgi:hypothetical protein
MLKVKIFVSFLCLTWTKGELRSLQATPAGNNPVLLVVSCLVHEAAGRLEEAMRSAHQGATKLSSPECRALLVQLFLRNNRQSEADRELRLLAQQDEDSPLAILTAARAALASGSAARAAERCPQLVVCLFFLNVSPVRRPWRSWPRSREEQHPLLRGWLVRLALCRLFFVVLIVLFYD